MANVNAPQGLRPVADASGRPYSAALKRYALLVGETNDLYIGDPVIVGGSADADGVPNIVKATAGATNKLTGAIVGFEPSASIVANGYRVGATVAYALVCDDPNALYEIQASTLALGDLEANSILASGTGSALTGSGFYMDTATKGASATYQLRIVGISQRPDNALGQYCKALVRINLHTELGLPDGLGY